MDNEKEQLIDYLSGRLSMIENAVEDLESFWLRNRFILSTSRQRKGPKFSAAEHLRHVKNTLEEEKGRAEEALAAANEETRYFKS